MKNIEETSMEPILEIRDISKAFGGLQAISHFDLQVGSRDLVGIIGPNGAGKTTLFNMITGFIPSDSGEILFKKENITYLKPYQVVGKGIARTFQLVDLFKEMTAIENVMISCFSHRAKKHKVRVGEKPWETAMGYLEEMGLGDRFNEKVKNMAFGELRLLDIARAMATQPDILLLDEPFSGLDNENVEVLSAAIRHMHNKGQAMVIIEHRLKDLLKLVERVVCICFGEKIGEGNPKDIMCDPQVCNAYLGGRSE
ncbi:MAG: ABC transporter ATP-binding protein [Thermodesulfobacteriota bacterium]|jgi:branched-chain amino acid transport system ATP-binding protein